MAGKGGDFGGGRPKGSPNKITASCRQALQLAFDGVGGVDGLIKWIKASDENRAAFYTRVYPKLAGTGREDTLGDHTIGHYIISDRPMTPERWEAYLKEQGGTILPDQKLQ
jgi:hypothetical protein